MKKTDSGKIRWKQARSIDKTCFEIRVIFPRKENENLHKNEKMASDIASVKSFHGKITRKQTF
jgi:hypothetical protein